MWRLVEQDRLLGVTGVGTELRGACVVSAVVEQDRLLCVMGAGRTVFVVTNREGQNQKMAVVQSALLALNCCQLSYT
jgi:hypothetical protein